MNDEHAASLVEYVFDVRVRKFVRAVLPTLAALLMWVSWPSLDIQSTAHQALRLVGSPGHGVVNDIVDWLRAPDRRSLFDAMPYAVGALFALGGGYRGHRSLGTGNGTALAWVLMVPAAATGGRSTVAPMLAGALVTVGVLAVVLAVGDHSDDRLGFAHLYTARDLPPMLGRSVLYIFMVPAMPLMVLYGYVVRTVTWPDSPAVTRLAVGPVEAVTKGHPGSSRLDVRRSHLVVRCRSCQTVVPIHSGDVSVGTLRSIERALEPCLGKGWLK